MNEDEMKLNLLPEALEEKELLKEEIDRFISNTSIENLVLQLRYMRRNGYLDFQVTLDKSYLAFIEERQTLALRTDGSFIGTPDLGFNMMNDGYGLERLHRKIGTNEPLTESEIVLVAKNLPKEMSSQYLRYKLFNIDWPEYEELVSEHPANTATGASYARVEYKGLVVDGTDVNYLGKPIQLGAQQREALRLLIEAEGGMCFRDEFFVHSNGIFTKDDYPDPNLTLRRLIYDLRKVLKRSIGRNVIQSRTGVGYKLSI